MEKRPIYSIGYGNRKLEDFIFLLKSFDIEYLIDIRSQPYSKFNPQFNQNDLKFFLKENGIRYVFMGDLLGGRPEDVSCYNDEGKVDYEIVKTKDFYLNGIDRIRTAFEKNINVVLMCSENKPGDCHRSKLIGKTLLEKKILFTHIDENGRIKDQITVLSELNKGLSEYNIFGNSNNTTSRNSYL